MGTFCLPAGIFFGHGPFIGLKPLPITDHLVYSREIESFHDRPPQSLKYPVLLWRIRSGGLESNTPDLTIRLLCGQQLRAEISTNQEQSALPGPKLLAVGCF